LVRLNIIPDLIAIRTQEQCERWHERVTYKLAATSQEIGSLVKNAHKKDKFTFIKVQETMKTAYAIRTVSAIQKNFRVILFSKMAV
jgi:transcriptional regulator NrdR family protein